MDKLTELYKEKEIIQKRVPQSWAGAQKRHLELAKVEQEIAYYEEGDTISKASVQESIEEIKQLEAEKELLNQSIHQKKKDLNKLIFGTYDFI